MKASELRIGNYVYVEHDKNNLELLKFDFESGWYMEYIKPIPLTEEWLLKFGFEKAYETCYQYKDFILNDKFIMMDIDITIQLKHVHQLQNLYFALTGEEL